MCGGVCNQFQLKCELQQFKRNQYRTCEEPFAYYIHNRRAPTQHTHTHTHVAVTFLDVISISIGHFQFAPSHLIEIDWMIASFYGFDSMRLPTIQYWFCHATHHSSNQVEITDEFRRFANQFAHFCMTFTFLLPVLSEYSSIRMQRSTILLWSQSSHVGLIMIDMCVCGLDECMEFNFFGSLYIEITSIKPLQKKTNLFVFFW